MLEVIRNARMEILMRRFCRRMDDLREQLWFECACWREARGDDEC